MSCASRQKAYDAVFEDRPFLNEYTTYALTSGVGNTALDVSMDTKGRWVYFSRERFGNTDIYAVDSYTLDSYRLTRSPGIDQSVSIDSKSRYLVFSSTRDDAFSDIYMYKLTRYGLRKGVNELESLEQNTIKLTSYKGYDVEPKISHNGELIAFVSYRENNTPYIYTMRNSGKDVVRRSDIPSKTPSFSFNDRYVVFSTANVGEKTSQIAILDLTLPLGANTATLTETDTFKFDPVFYNDDTILYFEVDNITNASDITYASKRRLMSFSLSTRESYVLSENTELTKFYVAYPSAAVGAYISHLDGFGNVRIGSTKPYFIKDENASVMYKTFSALTYDKQVEKSSQFKNYFPLEEDKETVAKSYFDIMCKSYTNGNYKNYEEIKKVILNNYTNTLVGREVLKIEETFFPKNTETNINIASNTLIPSTNNLIQVNPVDATEKIAILKEVIPTDILVWSKYIIAAELIKKGGWNNNGLALDELEYIINIEPSDKNLYILISKLYTKSLILNSISYYDEAYNTPYKNNNISFSDKLNIAKQFVIDSNYDYERLIEVFNAEHIVSLATKLIYLDSLIISGSTDKALSMFEVYLNSKNNLYKALALYAYGKIHLDEKNDNAYSEFANSIEVGGKDFNETKEAKEVISILSSYYRTLADTAYNDGRHAVSYENYRQVLKYNPNDSIAAIRVMESALKSFSDIDTLEETIKSRESSILKTRYSDHSAHAELASTYYYLASRYYSLAIEKEKSQDRYLVHDKRREDAFYYYLNKSFTSITKDAVGYIDFAIFLNPDNPEYYIKKAEMLSFAQGIRMQVLQDDKTSKSILEILPTYSQDNKNAVKYSGYSKLSFQTTDIDGAIINSLIEAKRRIVGENTKLSLMLANAYLVNRRYLDAAKEYKNAAVIMNETESKKTLAWYYFFYGYSLWMNNDVENAFGNYKKAKELFLELDDRESVYRVVGYAGIAAIEQNNYQKAVDYLLERQKFIEEYKIKDELNDLLLAVSYLKMEDYNNALLYCDRAKSKVDNLNSAEYKPNYLSFTFFGANFNFLNMGLASFGGYIPGEPLNIDKQQMLYSLYQELYEKTGRYTEARNALTSYKDYIVKDKPKESIKPLMLATYMNNEGYLYYRQGSDAEAVKAFRESINEFKKTVKTEEETYKNAANDVKNYLSLSSLYLRYLSMGSLTNFKSDFYKELNDVSERLKVLATNESVTPKDKLIIQTHIAGSEYIFAFKIASDPSIYNAIVPKRKDNVNAEELINYDRNVQKLMLLKDAINRYEYILSKNSNYPVDLKTEIIIRYNLGKSYELAGNIENAAREYVSSYSKAKNSMFAVEEISILTTMIDFSAKYQSLYPESIDKQEEYVKRIMTRLKESVFMITFVEDGSYILKNAKDVLINYYGLNNPNESINVLSAFDSLELRRKFLNERLYTLGRNNAYLQKYYIMYESALISYQKYLNSVATHYNKKEEDASLKEIRELEKEARATFKNTPISAIAIGEIDTKSIENSMRKDETLIWDTPQGIRFIKEESKSSAYFTTNNLINTKNYVTHIGEQRLFITNNITNSSLTNTKSVATNNILTTALSTNTISKTITNSVSNNFIINDNLFIREIKDITSYILPPKTSLMRPTLYSASKITKEYENAVLPTYMYITNIIKTTNEYTVTNYQSTNEKISKNQITNYTVQKYISNIYTTNVIIKTNENVKFNFINIDALINYPYAPVFLDMTDITVQQIKKLTEKRLYVIYVNRNIYEQNIDLFNLMDPIAIIVGENQNTSRAVFYSNYFTNMQTKTLEESMKGYNRELFTIYGKPDTQVSSFNDSVKTFKQNILTSYKNTKAESSRKNLIRYAESEEEKLGFYKMFLEDSVLAKDFLVAQTNADLGFKLIIQNKETIKETNAFSFMKLYPSAFRGVTNESIILRNADRVLWYASFYTNTKTDIISDYFTVFNLSRFLQAQKNIATAANYVDFISQNIKGINREKILEMSIIYHALYAKSDTNRLTYYLDEATNGYKALEIANTILSKPETLTNDSLFFDAMNYIYANQFFFTTETVSYFADTFYKKYSSNPSYIFGLLEKSRMPESNFEENIKDAYQVFSNEKNTMFMFYTIDNSKYTLYSYLAGDISVKKNIFSLSKKVSELNTNFIKAVSFEERLKALDALEKELINKNVQADILSADKIYITGSYQVFNIPFAYFNSFRGKDTVKVKEIKYGNNNINKIESKVDFSLLRDNNFYSGMEFAGVNSLQYDGENKYQFTHYAGETNIVDFKSDVFLSPASQRDVFYYIRSKNDTRLFFTYTYSDTGDYFTVMKKLYSGFDNGIIESYRAIRSSKKDKIQPITSKDNSIYYAESESLFDYIIPYIPKAENIKN